MESEMNQRLIKRKRRVIVHINHYDLRQEYTRSKLLKSAADTIIRDVENYISDSWDKVKVGFHLTSELVRYRGREFVPTLRRAGLLIALDLALYPIHEDLKNILGRRFRFVKDDSDTICEESVYGDPPGPEIGCYAIDTIKLFLHIRGPADVIEEHCDCQVEFFLDEERPVLHVYFNRTLIPEDVVYEEERMEKENEYMEKLREKFVVWENYGEFTIPDNEWKMFMNPELARMRKKLEDRTVDVMMGQSILMVREWNKHRYSGLRFSIPYGGNRVVAYYWTVAPRGAEINKQAVIPAELMEEILSELYQTAVINGEERKIVEADFWTSILKTYRDDIENLKQNAEPRGYYARLIYP